MKTKFYKIRWVALAVGLVTSAIAARSQDNSKTPSSYAQVDIHESFSTVLSRMTAAKPEIMKRQMALLEQRYDLNNRPAQGVKMSGGKAVQQGVRVKLASGTTWDQLSKLSPEQIKERDLFPCTPAGYYSVERFPSDVLKGSVKSIPAMKTMMYSQTMPLFADFTAWIGRGNRPSEARWGAG